MLKAIIFDFDGVLVDSEPLHYRAIHRVTEDFGVRFSYDEYVSRLIGYDDRDAIRVALGGTPGSNAALPAGTRLEDLCERKTEAFAAIVAEGIEAIPGSAELVRAAAAEMPIAIASGAIRREIDLMLDRLGLADAFELIVSADMVANSKPDPQTYMLAVEKLAALHPSLSLSPGTCLSIEDTPAGIASARGAGLQSLGLASTGSADRLAKAHRVVDSLVGVTPRRLREWFD